MAQKFNSKINVEEAKVALLTEAVGGDTYGAPMDMSGLQSVDMQVTVAEAILYGDGVALDKIAEFVSGTANENTAGEDDDVLALINGQTVESGEVIDNGKDTKPFLGQSFIAKTRKKDASGVKEGYTAYFLPKIKFQPAGETLTAKTDSITYSTSALVATIFANRDLDWRRRKFFSGPSALTEARAWVDGKFGVTPVTPVTP